MRITKKYPLNSCLTKKLFLWSNKFSEVAWLHSNNYQQDPYSNFDLALAVGNLSELLLYNPNNAFDKLEDYHSKVKDYIFGYLSYDLKNGLEEIQSNNEDVLAFPELYFFQPERLIFIKGEYLIFEYPEVLHSKIDTDYQDILNQSIEIKNTNSPIKIVPRLEKSTYYKKIEKVLSHIQRGNFYEANFCMAFHANVAVFDPVYSYLKLEEIAKSPFASYFKHKEFHILSASPERYIRKISTKLICQPIKGTIQRGSNTKQDSYYKKQLENSLKDQTENVMIVDLVRNDLSYTAQKGSVKVEEFCKVYSFNGVHQMISTISSQLSEGFKIKDIFKTTFPMGSMTGAPKLSAMKIMEDLEEDKRSIYSGSIGYISPEKDFDFNVVIRSILYNSVKKALCFSVGGAITNQSTSENEWLECLLKAQNMRKALEI